MAYIALSTRSVRISAQEGSRIVEVACIEVRDGVPTGESFHRYINPAIEVSEEALKAHGIESAQLADKPPFAEMAPYFCDFIRGRAVIVLDLDQVALLEREFMHLIGRLLPPWRGKVWDLDEQCSLQSLSMLAQVIEVPAGSGLTELCAHYGIQPPASSGAVDEAKCVGAVYATMEPDIIAWESKYGELILGNLDEQNQPTA